MELPYGSSEHVENLYHLYFFIYIYFVALTLQQLKKPLLSRRQCSSELQLKMMEE